MGHSQYDGASRERAAWNAGKRVGTKRPLTQKQIWAVRFFLDRGCIRDRALFDLAIDSKLRGCDLVKISRTGNQNPGDRYSAEDRSSRPIRDHDRRESQPFGLARTARRFGRGLCLPEPGRSRTPHEHKAICPPR